MDPHLKFIGPPLDQGPLPAVFYFALSAEDSLELDPFNQPALHLLPFNIRVFSITLPGHDILPAKEALKYWADHILKEDNIIEAFVTKTRTIINTLMQDHVIEKDKLAVMGLSRGFFIACHVAASMPLISTILGFAPLTHLAVAKEFPESAHSLLMCTLKLNNLENALADRRLRFYIGNHDTRVGTKHCFDFFSSLVQKAVEKKIRPVPMELIITPSIGHQGHGTSPETFCQGAKWLGKILEAR